MAWTWSSGLSAKPPLDPEFLWAKGSAGFDAADERTGRNAEDIADFRERLAALCNALREEAQLNALGHAMAYGQLTAAIRTRHALGRLWRRRPELPRAALAAPIVVVGQMRSGTTRLHRLLAADPGHSGTRFCNTLEPVPRIPDTRPLRSMAGLAVARRINPWLDTLHPFGATRVDEELGWLSWALNPCAYEAQWRIPSYVAWSEARDPAPVYRELDRVLRGDSAAMGDSGRPRVLKCPQYAEDLPALLARFPDARVVVTRRDRDEVLASTVSVVASQMAYQSDGVSLAALEAEWRRKLDLRERRTAQALTDFSGPRVEVAFADLDRDWREQVARVYAELKLTLSPTALAAMEREQARAERAAHRSHAQAYRQFPSRMNAASAAECNAIVS